MLLLLFEVVEITAFDVVEIGGELEEEEEEITTVEIATALADFRGGRGPRDRKDQSSCRENQRSRESKEVGKRAR